jgi:hypothetical protein
VLLAKQQVLLAKQQVLLAKQPMPRRRGAD